MEGTNWKAYGIVACIVLLFFSLILTNEAGTPYFLAAFTSGSTPPPGSQAQFWEPAGHSRGDFDSTPNLATPSVGSLLSGGGSATSGKLFSGAKIREFDRGSLRFTDDKIKAVLDKSSPKSTIDEHLDELYCNHWAVVTTIFEPSEAVIKQAKVDGWCMVVVGDKKGPTTYEIDGSSGSANHGELSQAQKRALRYSQRPFVEESDAVSSHDPWRDRDRVLEEKVKPEHTEGSRPTFIYLTPKDQEELSDHLPIIKLLPWNHFGRKNVGYLYAIMHGAEVIWDFDDDNGLLAPLNGDDKVHMHIEGFQMSASSGTTRSRELSRAPGEGQGRDLSRQEQEQEQEQEQIAKHLAKQKRRFLTTKEARGRRLHRVVDSLEFPSTAFVRRVKSSALAANQTSFNPYPAMGAPHLPSWPRGLPLLDIKADKMDNDWSDLVELSKSRIGIIQSLANIDPDMDAIYRLTMPIPFDFPSDAKKARPTSSAPQSRDTVDPKNCMVEVPLGLYSPYNAQATLHLYSSLWSLLLPITVHGRVSDIWRGYFMQRIAHEIDIQLLFAPSIVEQDRNAHNYLADFQSEQPLYLKSQKLVEQLHSDFTFGFTGDKVKPGGEYPSATRGVPGLIEHVWVYMYERGYIEMHDVKLVQAWLESLVVVGYKFPTVKRSA